LDNLVMIRVVGALDEGLRGAVLREFREESAHRFRLRFEREGRYLSLLISLAPREPWIGRPAGRWLGPKRKPGPFTAACSRSLDGGVLTRAAKPGADRAARLEFADGRRLVAELATHRANLVLLDPQGSVVVAARKPRSSRERIEPGRPYEGPALPGSLLNPHAATALEIDGFLERRRAAGESVLQTLRRGLFGLGAAGARLILDESEATGAGYGDCIVQRLSELRRGLVDPVIEAAGESLAAVRTEGCTLWPWPPSREPVAGSRWFRLADAAATAGSYHEILERGAQLDARATGLETLIERRLVRLAHAEAKARHDLQSFEDPERFKRWGEALLAGIGVAVRRGSSVVVPDPYRADGATLAVPVRGGQTPQQAADRHFRNHRRALRGLRRARERAEELAGRRTRLQEIRARFDQRRDAGSLQELEAALRAEGLPVALEAPTRAGRAAARVGRPRMEGVRLFTSDDGIGIMVGKSGSDNHRLTFKLATPDDFWFHALGFAGAHVVVRSEGRSRLPEVTLKQAAALAAWFSEARRQALADVQWTRRKYVRRPRGAPPGTVLVKKSETIRVRPRTLAGD